MLLLRAILLRSSSHLRPPPPLLRNPLLARLSTFDYPKDRAFLEESPFSGQEEHGDPSQKGKDAIFSEGEAHEDPPDDPPEPLSFRVERLPVGTPVASAFQSWMGEGFCVHRGDVFHAINRLRKRKMYKRALEDVRSIRAVGASLFKLL